MLQQLIKKVRGLGEEDAENIQMTVPLAATALLLEIAYADQHASDEELKQIQHIVIAHFGLPDADVATLMQEADELYRDSVGAQPLTRTLTEAWSEPQRYQLVVALWQVALADDGIDPLEEHRIRRLADLLYLSHSRFIQAKLEAKEPSS